MIAVSVATGDELDPTHTYALAENDVVVRHEPREGLVLSARNGVTVAVDTTIDERLRREGLAREIVRVVQAARREAGVGVTDRIELRLGGSPDLLGAARAHERYVAEETLATAVAYAATGGDRRPGPAPSRSTASRSRSSWRSRRHSRGRRRRRTARTARQPAPTDGATIRSARVVGCRACRSPPP